MNRLIALIAFSSAALSALAADPPVPLAEEFLHSGRFAEGETALLLALDADPVDDEARFGLGVIQFMRAIENLGRALHEYGAVSEEANEPLLRLPVPKNDNPSTVSYKALGRVLDAFATDLGRAESTLAGVRGEDVKLRLRLAQIPFDFDGTGAGRTPLMSVLTKLNNDRPLAVSKTNPDLRVHLDRGDVAWLRAYCHLLSATVEGYRAFDEEAGFAKRVEKVFPKVEPTADKEFPTVETGLRVVDPPRLRRMRLHLVAVCELNRETWEHLRRETDDDHEWLPHPGQTDQFGLPLSDEQIDAWLAMMGQWEGLLKGERLFPGRLITLVFSEHDVTKSLNVRKLLDDPPADFFSFKTPQGGRRQRQASRNGGRETRVRHQRVVHRVAVV